LAFRFREIRGFTGARRHALQDTPPGKHLAEELKELSISAAELARQIGVGKRANRDA
jgi:plasmid maintenance system antidote protein VapI